MNFASLRYGMPVTISDGETTKQYIVHHVDECGIYFVGVADKYIRIDPKTNKCGWAPIPFTLDFEDMAESNFDAATDDEINNLIFGG